MFLPPVVTDLTGRVRRFRTAVLAAYPGARTFSFRSATMAQGRLVAYAGDGLQVASYDEELAAALRTITR